MSSACRDIFTKPADARQPLYSNLISSLVAARDTAAVLQVASHLLTKEGSDQYGRTYCTPPSLLLLLSLLRADDCAIEVEEMTPLLQQLTELLRPRHDDYPQVLCETVDLLSRCYQALGEYKSAAYALASFKWDDVVKKTASGGSGASEWMRVSRRVDWYVRTAEFFLHEQETGSASQQIKRAHALINELPKHSAVSPIDPSSSSSSFSSENIPLLVLRFRTCYARVLDSERRFLEAAQRYLELSHSPSDLVSPADALTSLQNAVTCAILAKPSPSRTRILSLLYQDDRTQQLPQHALLSKVYRGRVIPHDEVSAFESQLAEHQKAETSAGMTVVRASLVEHNISAMGSVYRNVGVHELSQVLGVSVDECEKITGEMIEQGRLRAKIDQVDGYVEFEEDAVVGSAAAGQQTGGSSGSGTGLTGGDSGGSGVESVLRWDSQIEDLCLQVNRIVDSIQSRYPQFVLQ